MQPNSYGPRKVTFDAFTDAWSILTKDIGIYAVCTLIWIVLVYAVTLPISFLMQGALMAQIGSLPPQEQMTAMFTSPLYWGQFGLQSILGAVVAPLTICISRMALRRMRGEPITIGMMFEFNGRYGQLFAFSFLLALIGSIGFALCLIPGIIFYALMLPAGLLILEKGMPAVQAMQTSIADLKLSLCGAVGLVLVSGLVAFAGALMCGVGFLFLGPIYFCVQAAVYRELYDYGTPTDAPQAPGSYYRPPPQG
jgi:hypothetical protein